MSHHIHSVFSLTAAQNLFLLASIITISLSAEPHFCPAGCHEGPCPRCEKSRLVRCRCGRGSTRVECQNLEGIGDFVCDKPCNKMKSCGRHRCNTRCCMVSLSLSLSLSLKKGEKYVAEWGISPSLFSQDANHQCTLVCGKRLRCGIHNCMEQCHRGHCEQCWEYSESRDSHMTHLQSCEGHHNYLQSFVLY